MAGNSRIRVPWSDLSKDILEKIAKRLDTEIDVLRFRAVCSSWRSSTTSFKKFPCETIKLPFPIDARKIFIPKHPGGYASLVERIIYRVESPDSENPNFWLVKIERLSNGKLRILNPVSHRTVKIPPETKTPKVLNILDFRISEVCKAYTLQYVNPYEHNEECEFSCAKKVVVSACKNDEYVVMAIDDYDNLWYIKSGDEKWNMVSDYYAGYRFHDVVNYNGQFQGIDVRGGIWEFDSVFDWTRISYNMYKTALKRHLVELDNGELFLVEEMRVKDKRPTRYKIIDERTSGLRGNIARKPDVDVIIYAFNKNEKEWAETKAVNDWIIVVGADCSYSVSTKEFEGCKGTRVFYPDWCISIDPEADEDYYSSSECYCSDCYESYDDDTGVENFIPSDEVKLRFRGFHGDNVGVCDYETGKTGSTPMCPEYADIFWPPPSWLDHS